MEHCKFTGKNNDHAGDSHKFSRLTIAHQ